VVMNETGNGRKRKAISPQESDRQITLLGFHLTFLYAIMLTFFDSEIKLLDLWKNVHVAIP
jgi:hypothetical protein